MLVAVPALLGAGLLARRD
ncbi:PGF-CTERM sorting domain-containing protein [Haloarcula quadrata]